MLTVSVKCIIFFRMERYDMFHICPESLNRSESEQVLGKFRKKTSEKLKNA